MVGLGRFELPTSPLSGVRSSQLSYRPGNAGSAFSRSGSLALQPGFSPKHGRLSYSLEIFEDTVERANRLRRL